MLQQARLKIPPDTTIHCIASDARQICTSAPFDRILLSYSLSLMPDPLRVLQTAYDHLIQGGVLVIADFGAMARWGLLGNVISWWIGKHSVRPACPEIRRFALRHPGTLYDVHLGYTLLARIPS